MILCHLVLTRATTGALQVQKNNVAQIRASNWNIESGFLSQDT